VSIVEAIASDIRARVFSGELPALHALTETEVASSYDVARPTAKAAIEKLVAEGLLARGVHKTARVTDLGPESVRDIYQARAYLESEVLRRLASGKTVPEEAVRANNDIAALKTGAPLDVVEPDMRFHTSLVDALGNQRISKMYLSLVGGCASACPGSSPCTCWTRTSSRPSTRGSSS
jgi:DNA-binding GntR family transcriptional regulator